MAEITAKTLSSCIIKKVVAETTPEAISNMAEFERNELIARIHGECIKEIGN